MILHFNNHLNFLGTLDGSLISRCSTLIKSFGPGNQWPVNLCPLPLPCFLLSYSPVSKRSQCCCLYHERLPRAWKHVASALYEVYSLSCGLWEVIECFRDSTEFVTPFSTISSSETTHDYKQFMTERRRRSSPRLLLFCAPPICLLHPVSAPSFSCPDTLDTFTRHCVRCRRSGRFKCSIWWLLTPSSEADVISFHFPDENFEVAKSHQEKDTGLDFYILIFST